MCLLGSGYRKKRKESEGEEENMECVHVGLNIFYPLKKKIGHGIKSNKSSLLVWTC